MLAQLCSETLLPCLIHQVGAPRFVVIQVLLELVVDGSRVILREAVREDIIIYLFFIFFTAALNLFAVIAHFYSCARCPAPKVCNCDVYEA